MDWPPSFRLRPPPQPWPSWQLFSLGLLWALGWGVAIPKPMPVGVYFLQELAVGTGLILVLRTVLAAGLGERSKSWIFYAGLMLTSPLWGVGLIELGPALLEWQAPEIYQLSAPELFEAKHYVVVVLVFFSLGVALCSPYLALERWREHRG